jgi:hypothetical protein
VHGGHTRVARADPTNAFVPTDDGTDTGGSSQNSLNAIAVLELCADVLPTIAPVVDGAIQEKNTRGG